MPKPNLKEIERRQYQQAVNNFINSGTTNNVATEADRIWKSKSPYASDKLNQYNQYKSSGGRSLSPDAQNQLFSPSFYMPKTLSGYDPKASGQAFKDQLAYQILHRNEGLWDVKGNRASVLSDAFLLAEIGALQADIRRSKKEDETWNTTKAQKMAEYEAAVETAERWKQLYSERERGYKTTTEEAERYRDWLKLDYDLRDKNAKFDIDKVIEGPKEEAARWYNWLMADYLLGDREEPFDFDTINQRYDAMSDDEYYAEEARLKEQFDNLDWDSLMNPTMPTYNSQTGALEKRLAEYQAEQAYRNNISAYRDIANQTEGTLDLRKYYEDTIEGYDPEWHNPEYYTDPVYYINNSSASNALNIVERLTDGVGEGIIKDLTGILTDEDAQTVRGYFDKGYDYLLPEEIAIYNDLMSTDPTMAGVFLKNMESQLLARKAAYQNQETALMAGDPVMGSLMSAVTVATNPYASLQTIAGSALGADKNDPVFDLTRDDQMVRTAAAKKWGELLPVQVFGQPLGSTIYNTLMSMGDMLMAHKAGSAFTGGTNKAAQATMQVVMSSEVMANTIYDDLQKGYTNEQATIHGFANGIIEAWMERGFMDELFDYGKGFNARVIGSMLAEGGEEVGTEILQVVGNELAAYLTGRESEVNQVYQAYKNSLNYGEDPGLATLRYYANQFALAGLSGSAMGAGVATTTGISEIARDTTYGRMLKNDGDLEGVLHIAESYSNNADVATPAKKIRDKQAKGFKVTARDMGELVHSLSNAIGEKNSKVLTDVLTDSVEGRLEELGETPENAKKLAQSISNMYLGKKITMAERASLKWTDTASQVFKELNSTETVSKNVVPGSIAGTEGQAEDGRYVAGDAAAAEKNRVGHSWKTAADEKIAAAQRDAFMETVRLNEALNTKTSTTTAVGKAHDKAKNLMKGKPKMATREVMAEGSDGKEVTGTFERVERKNGKLLMVMKDASDAEVKVDADKITNGGDEGVLTIINYAQEGARHEMSADEINTMVNTYLHEGGDVDSFVQQFQDNYLSGYSGVNAPVGTISGGIASIAYEHGKAEAIKDEADRVARAQKARKVEVPSVGWLGDVTSDTAIKGLGDAGGLDEAVKNMTATQQAMVEFGRRLAETAKINIAFFASKAGADGKYTTQNGSYDPNTHTIYLDINSGASTESGRQELMKSGTLGAAIGRVAGHELTHVLEATSPEYYGKYKQAVKTALKAKNLDYASLVREKINAALATGEKLTYAGAEAEVIADASEYMLQDSKFVKNMDQGLKGKVKEIVQKFLNKVNEAFRALTGGHIESAALRTMTDGVAHYEKHLQDLWDMAFDEMLGADVRTEAPVAEVPNEAEKVQQSRERDDVYMAAVERGDMATAQRMVDEAAKAAGYEPVKLYHGTRQFGFTEFNTDKSDDKISIFVTDDRRIAESYSREGADIPVKNGIKQERYDFMQQSSAKLEPYVQKWVDKNLKVPTERELRAYTDGESATILSAVDWVDDYLQSNWDSLNTEAKSAISKAMFYAEKLAAIPSADMEDETDGYALRMKFEDAVQDLAWEDRNSYEEIAPVLSRPVYESANNLINARFNDPFYNVNDGTFVSKWDVTDKLGDKLFTGIYELYGDMENLLEIDANDSNWNKIDGKTIGRDGVFVTTREVAEFAKKNGFNGVKIKNVRDGGGMTGYHAASNVLIFFNSTDLKSADPVTYDDSGNVIPPSERFNAANEDIRYSHRSDYVHPFVGMQNVLSGGEYHSFATSINQKIRKHPNQKNFVESITYHEDDTKVAFVQKTGTHSYAVTALYKLNTKLYTGRIIELINTLEGAVNQHGHEQVAKWLQSPAFDVWAAFYSKYDQRSGEFVDFREFDGTSEEASRALADFRRNGNRRTVSEGSGPLTKTSGDNDSSSPDGIEIDDDTESAYPTQKSIRTWAESDYVAHRNEAAERLAKTIGVSTAKAKKWIDDVNSISAYILGNKARLDYIPTAVKGMSAFKSNPEYGGSIDMSTICAKRRLATGTLDAIQRVLGDAVLTKDDFLHIREMMKERGHEVACGLCFVESSRKNLSKYNKQFLDQYKAEHPDSELGMVDLNTVEGLERIRSNPDTADVYEAYEKFMNKLAQRKPKLFEKRTEYNHEILKKFKSDTTVGVKNRNGGLRLQSFSDFEIVHLIDMMQVITDMASVGLAGQAYTKVPDFAWALGDTGLKINLPLIAKDVDADGNLIFDDVEGMNHLEAEKLRNAYSKNVGTIVVTFTDEQTIAAMKSDFIDYIIPFHRSQWQKGDYKKLGLPEGTKDYTIHQNEKEGRKRVKENFLPNAYWQDDLSGTENAKYYLDMCAKAGRTPKFAKFLVNNGDGSYSLQPDGSTDGYWKLLIGFKMYDNDGNRSKQLPVQPNFNMEQAMRMLEDYKGEHDSFPVAQDVVDAFVKEYRGDVGGVKNTDGRYTVSPVQQSIRDLPEDTATYRDYLTEADSSIAATIEERNALSIYQKLLKNHAEASEKVIEAEAALAAADEAHKPEARKALAAARVKQKDLYNRLLNVERQAHVQTLVKRSNQIIGDLYGKDQAELDKMLADKERRIASLKADITGLKGAARTQREADIREQEREVAALKSKATKALLANSERYQRQIDDIRLRRDINIEIGKRTRHIKRIVKRLNDRIIHEEDYKNVKEPLKPVVHKLVQTFIDGFGNMVFDQKTADRLRSVYDEIANEDGAPEFYSDDVANWLSELSDMKEWDALIRAEGSSSLGAAEEKLTAYSKVAEIADHIYKLVTAADEIFIDGKREKFNAFSTETGTALIERKDSKLLVGKARDAYNAFQNLLVKGNLTPQFFFEHLKNSGMTRLFDGLMRGQTEYAQAIREGQEAISDAKKRYNFYSWQNMKTGVQFHTEQGHDIVLTVPVMMSIYATAKREAANKLMDTHHLDQGGFRYDEKNIPRQKGKPWKAAPGSDLLHKLSKADVEMISNTLTAEQKACADELVSYLSNECAAQGNRASMELFGIKKYSEEYYFPFKTDSNQRNQRSDAGAASTTNDARVKHTSFTHSLRKGANTPLVMGDFFDVIADHINLMATYSSFVVPIESMNRVMNTKINEEADGSGNNVTIRSLIGRKYGEASQKYIADLLKDLNGGPQTDNRGGLSALFRAFKRGAVMGSLSVTLQQPTAIIRAFAYVNPKYFAHITMEGNKKTWDRMMKHSGTAVIKEMGKFDVGTGHMANDWIANSDIQEYNVLKRARFLMKTEGWKAVKDNTIEFLTSLPGVMDRITWTHIWKAVEAEQADQHPGMDRNSDEFLDMVGKRFDDVVNHTQVYDSVLAKSQNMRSKNPLTQMSTAFMSEPTLNANLYYSAVTGDHTAGQRAGIVTSVIASNLLAAAMASLISAWNKDDDDRKFTEKYLAAFASRAVDNLNPMTMYPYLSDLWSMVSGYDIERTDMSVVQDIWDYGSSFVKKLADGEDITWRDRENFYGTIANLFGIPAKNVSRDFRRIRNLINTDKSASSPSAIKYTLYENAIPLGLWKDSNTAYYDRYLAALKDGDKQEQYDLKDYLTSTKNVKESDFVSGVRDAYKKEYKKGGIKKEDAISFLLANNLVTGETADKKKQSAFQYVDKWDEGTANYSAYNTLESAFADGNSAKIQQAWNELTRNGYSNEQVGTQARSCIKALVESGTITPSKATELLRKWYPYKNDKDNLNKPKEWAE